MMLALFDGNRFYTGASRRLENPIFSEFRYYGKGTRAMDWVSRNAVKGTAQSCC